MDSRFDHATQQYVLKGTRPPASPFEWRRFVVEEDARRKDTRVVPVNKTSRKQTLSIAPKPFYIYNLSKKASSK